jgi:glucose-1-phosphate adenylyltransferase
MKTRYAAILNLIEKEDNLAPLTDIRPVATLPFACRYRLIDFPFSSLANAKTRSAALFIPGSGRSLYDHVRSGIYWGLDNLTGGGVFTHSQLRLKAEADEAHGFDPYYYTNHRRFINRSKAEYVILTGSSILANFQIDAIYNYHMDKESDITAVYKKIPRNSVREDTIYSAYEFSENSGVKLDNIVPLTEYPYDDSLVAFGLDFLIAETSVFLEYIDRLEESGQVVSVNNILELATQNDNHKVSGFEYAGYMKAIEDMRSYFEANMDMLDEKNFNALFFRESPVLTKSKNSAPTYYGKSSSVKNSLFANDSEIYGTIENSLLFRQSFICQDSTINNSIIYQGCFVDEGAELNYVILDKRVHVEKGAKLEGTPEEPMVVPKGARVLSSGEIVEGRYT